MEKVDSIRRSSKTQNAPLPVLAILAKDIGDLAKKEKEVFSPILKRWHPLAAGVAVATLHSCYGNELKQFISGVTDLTFDSVQVLKAAQKLEKDLVLIAVEDSVDSEDGGKGLIREMPPFEAESAISSLTKAWIKARVDKLRELVDRNLQQEVYFQFYFLGLLWHYDLFFFIRNSSILELMFLTTKVLDRFCLKR